MNSGRGFVDRLLLFGVVRHLPAIVSQGVV